MDKVSMSYFFPSQDMNQNLLLKSKCDDVINFKICLQTTSKAMADREKKRGKQKYRNLNISKTKRAF